MSQKTVVAVHDVACHGRCSLTVALPILSAAGIQTSLLPTAVLSTHTGGFGSPAAVDLSELLQKTVLHWHKQGVVFDCIYSGYLTSQKQIDIFAENLELLKNENTVFIADPVMGDNGRLYSGFNAEFAEKMTALCCRADIIIPNITEACLMTGIKYSGEVLSENETEILLKRLYEKTGATVILTGIDCGEKIANAIFNGVNTEYVYGEKIPFSCHGTGDIFASCVTAAVLKGFSVSGAVRFGGEFVLRCLKKTVSVGKEKRNGVDFEECIPDLINLFNEGDRL